MKENRPLQIVTALFWWGEDFPSKVLLTVLALGKGFSNVSITTLLQQGRVSLSKVITALIPCAPEKCYSSSQLPLSATVLLQ